jgi:hypothetical protein
MGCLSISYLNKFAQGSVFIETGCSEGWTLSRAKEFGFSQIYGIELQSNFITHCKDKFKNDSTIKIIEGDSPDILREICTTLTEKATFWLDAHESGSDLASPIYGRCPLLEELLAINLSPIKDHVLMIDDIRLLNTHQFDFLQIEQVMEAIYNINPNYIITYIDGMEDGSFPNDILIATVDNK